jgi:hypothetical protein
MKVTNSMTRTFVKEGISNIMREWRKEKGISASYFALREAILNLCRAIDAMARRKKQREATSSTRFAEYDEPPTVAPQCYPARGEYRSHQRTNRVRPSLLLDIVIIFRWVISLDNIYIYIYFYIYIIPSHENTIARRITAPRMPRLGGSRRSQAIACQARLEGSREE